MKSTITYTIIYGNANCLIKILLDIIFCQMKKNINSYFPNKQPTDPQLYQKQIRAVFQVHKCTPLHHIEYLIHLLSRLTIA